MYNHALSILTNQILENKNIDLSDAKHIQFSQRLFSNLEEIHNLYYSLYSKGVREKSAFEKLLITTIDAFIQRPKRLKEKDISKLMEDGWILSNKLVGMSLYVDRFCGTLNNFEEKIPYLKKLGVNVVHLMPIMQSPTEEGDGGYAVSDFRQVDSRFGTNQDVHYLEQKLKENDMYLMMDIVLNHTSRQHQWVRSAQDGDANYQDYFYLYSDRYIPDLFDKTMPEIFPESSPGNFTYDPILQKWVMTVFHHYQWDLNYTNPNVLVDMLDNIFFYANIGVDILRIDAPAFIWKKIGTTSQNLPEAHTLLQLIKLCVQIASPGMALLGEAIVAPEQIIKYFGENNYFGKECDVAYNATHMALQWDALATEDTRIMRAAQGMIWKKPLGCTWLNYVRCHDDIGLGYDDWMIHTAGYDPYAHRTFIKDYYSGVYSQSNAKGALFAVNPKTNDARISGSLASLCGLEWALEHNHAYTSTAIKRIILMQSMTMFMGGIPMIYYGDEMGYINDYSYQLDASKSYDNRWMHRPNIDWSKIKKLKQKTTPEAQIFYEYVRMIHIRKKYTFFSDYNNIHWVNTWSKSCAMFIKYGTTQSAICIFNFGKDAAIIYYQDCLNKLHHPANSIYHITKDLLLSNDDDTNLIVEGYSYSILVISDTTQG